MLGGCDPSISNEDLPSVSTYSSKPVLPSTGHIEKQQASSSVSDRFKLSGREEIVRTKDYFLPKEKRKQKEEKCETQ